MTPEANGLPIHWGWMKVTDSVFVGVKRLLNEMAPDQSASRHWVSVMSTVQHLETGIYCLLLIGPGMPCGLVCDGPPEVKLNVTRLSPNLVEASWQHDPSQFWSITLPAKEPTV